ncbi:MAG TPA: hypothetical protein PK718_04170 [Candidatus Methanofastidiosa archaeon]|nr:hypothetical protein [Candidatus Methanofastidiosa archaeon]
MSFPNLNENTYSLLATMELCNRYNFFIPYIPTRVEEGKEGYDVALYSPIMPFYIQYKKTYERCNIIRNIKNVRLFKSIIKNKPYHSIDITDKQHNTLKSKYNNYKKRAKYCYCAPNFVSLEDLYKHYYNGKLIENSFMIEFKEMDYINDGKKHVICFEKNNSTALMCSEPYAIKSCFFMNNIKEYIGDIKEEDYFLNIVNYIEFITAHDPEIKNILKNNNLENYSDIDSNIKKISIIGLYMYNKYNIILGFLKLNDKK